MQRLKVTTDSEPHPFSQQHQKIAMHSIQGALTKPSSRAQLLISSVRFSVQFALAHRSSQLIPERKQPHPPLRDLVTHSGACHGSRLQFHVLLLRLESISLQSPLPHYPGNHLIFYGHAPKQSGRQVVRK